MAKVTIEGSITPSAFLARGERVEVQRTEKIDRLIAGGYVNVISEDGEVEEAPLPPAPDADAPPRSGAGSGREDWAEFLAAHPAGFVTEGKDRAELIADWDTWLQTQ